MPLRTRLERSRKIIAVCEDARQDSLDTPHGLDPTFYEPEDLFELVKECTGFSYLSEPERRLAVVAFDEGAEVAKKSIWYN